jgi:hypothetical protein
MSKLKNITVSLNGVERHFEGVNLSVGDKDDTYAVHQEVLDHIETTNLEFGGIDRATVEVSFNATGSFTLELGGDDLDEYDDGDEVREALEGGYAFEYEVEEGLAEALSNLDSSNVDLEFDVEAEEDSGF